jgi:protein gp37
MYFVNSMSDLFHEAVPFEFVDRVFAVMALCPQHTFQVLTKRPERMAEYFAGLDFDPEYPEDIAGSDAACRIGAAAGTLLDGDWIWGEGKRHRRKIEEFISDTHNDPSGLDDDDDYELKPVKWPLPNVWLGTSVENQEQADKRIPHLLKCPAKVRFISAEPLLGAIDLVDGGHGNLNVTDLANGRRTGIHWVIVGGESGPGARPSYTAWFDGIVDQCKAAGVAVFVKQLGANHRCEDEEFGDIPIDLKDPKGGNIAEFPHSLRLRQMPTAGQITRD